MEIASDPMTHEIPDDRIPTGLGGALHGVGYVPQTLPIPHLFDASVQSSKRGIQQLLRLLIYLAHG
jgi:hypothetical protein